MSDEVPLWRNPVELLKVLVTLAPEYNVRLALVDTIEYMVDHNDTLTVGQLMEVIAQTVSNLHHHVGEDDVAELDADDEVPGVPTAEELQRMFREQLNGED